MLWFWPVAFEWITITLSGICIGFGKGSMTSCRVGSSREGTMGNHRPSLHRPARNRATMLIFAGSSSAHTILIDLQMKFNYNVSCFKWGAV